MSVLRIVGKRYGLGIAGLEVYYTFGTGVVVARGRIATAAVNEIEPAVALTADRKKISATILNGKQPLPWEGARQSNVALWLFAGDEKPAELAESTDHIRPGSLVWVEAFVKTGRLRRMTSYCLKQPLPTVRLQAKVVERLGKERLIVTDCKQFKGASGSAIFDQRNRLIGIGTNATSTGDDGCIIATPIEFVNLMLKAEQEDTVD